MASLQLMSSEQLRPKWAESDDADERRELLDEMEIACIEEGLMAYEGVPFKGELKGGGYKDPEYAKLDQRVRHLKRRAADLEDGAEKAETLHELAESEANLQEMKEKAAEGRHSKQMKKLDNLETLIMKPLEGALVDDKGNKRSYVELKAFIVARRKQEDILLAQMEKDEAAAVKASMEEAKKEYALKMAQIKAGGESRKAEAVKAMAEEKKAVAEEKKAVAEEKKAEAEAKAAEAKKKMEEKKQEKADKKAAAKAKSKAKAAPAQPTDEKPETSDDEEGKAKTADVAMAATEASNDEEAKAKTADDAMAATETSNDEETESAGSKDLTWECLVANSVPVNGLSLSPNGLPRRGSR